MHTFRYIFFYNLSFQSLKEVYDSKTWGKNPHSSDLDTDLMEHTKSCHNSPRITWKKLQTKHLEENTDKYLAHFKLEKNGSEQQQQQKPRGK